EQAPLVCISQRIDFCWVSSDLVESEALWQCGHSRIRAANGEVQPRFAWTQTESPADVVLGQVALLLIRTAGEDAKTSDRTVRKPLTGQIEMRQRCDCESAITLAIRVLNDDRFCRIVRRRCRHIFLVCSKGPGRSHIHTDFPVICLDC